MDKEARRRRSERDALQIALLMDGYWDAESWVTQKARQYARTRLKKYHSIFGNEAVELLLDKLHDRVVTFVRDEQLLPGSGSDVDARNWVLQRLEWGCIDLTRVGGELWNWSNRREQPAPHDEESPIESPAERLRARDDTEGDMLNSLAMHERRSATRERCALAMAWALDPDIAPAERAERVRIANGVIVYLRVSQEIDLPRETPGRFAESVTGTAVPDEWDAVSMLDPRLVTSLQSDPINRNNAGVIRHRLWVKIKPFVSRYKGGLA